MAIEVEDGTGKATANSYASAAEADAYWADRSEASWSAAASADKDAALIKATDYIEATWSRKFRGSRVSSTQALSWPRVGAVDADGFTVASDSVPTPVKAAAYHLAVKALSADLKPVLSSDPFKTRSKVGPIEDEFERARFQLPVYTMASDLISKVLVAGGASLNVGAVIRG